MESVKIVCHARGWVHWYGVFLARFPFLFYPIFWALGHDRGIKAVMAPVARFGIRVELQ